jgi:hypothetical protein
MWVRSTGLGKRNDLVTEFEELKRDGDCWVLCMKTTEPVRWKIRVAMTSKDIRSFLLDMVLRKGNLLRLLPALFLSHSPEKPPEDY